MFIYFKKQYAYVLFAFFGRHLLNRNTLIWGTTLAKTIDWSVESYIAKIGNVQHPKFMGQFTGAMKSVI